MELIVGLIAMVLVFLLDSERDMCRTNFDSSLTYKVLPKSFTDKHRKWFTGNLWQQSEYEKHRLFKLPLPAKWEWFLVKNVISFLNDFWKFNKFLLMAIITTVFAVFSGYWWLTFPYFIVGGGLHSFLDTSLLRIFKKKEN